MSWRDDVISLAAQRRNRYDRNPFRTSGALSPSDSAWDERPCDSCGEIHAECCHGEIDRHRCQLCGEWVVPEEPDDEVR